MPSSPRSSSLFSLAEQLQQLQDAEPRRIVETLEQLERIPVTVELLRLDQKNVFLDGESEAFHGLKPLNPPVDVGRKTGGWMDFFAS